MANTNASPMARMELTPWDLQFIPLGPTQRGLLFHKPDKNFIDHLKNSLSRALEFFPPLAGRLGTIENDDNTLCFFVDCNNAGVEFTHAVAADVSVSDILEPTYIPEIISSFFPLNGVRNFEGITKPLLGVQATELVDGLFIGCAVNHVMVDGASFWHFFDSWSEISRGLDKISKTPVFDRWFLSKKVASDNALIRLPALMIKPDVLQNPVPTPLLERVFHINEEGLAKLKAKANFAACTDKISTYQALSALLWRVIIRCQHAKNNLQSSQEVDFILMVGARETIPLPDGYFGNAIYDAMTTTSDQQLLQSGLGYAALKINELVAQQTSEVAIKRLEERAKNLTWGKRSAPFALIAGSPRYAVYGNDFGWGKPFAVRSGKVPRFDGRMIIFPAAQYGGVDLEVCLAREKMQAMEDDAELREVLTI